MTENTYTPRILYPAKLSFKSEVEILSKKNKNYGKFIANRPSLLEMVEEILQEKETDIESKLRLHTEWKNFRENINEDKMFLTPNWSSRKLCLN